jgi:hypothetical protein
MRLLLTSLTALAMLVPGLSCADALEDLHKSFMSRYDAANTLRDEQIKKLDASYLAALERMQDKAKSTGNLDSVVPILDEIQAVKTAADPFPELPANATSELKQMRGKHTESGSKILKTHAETITGLFGKMDQALKSQEVELTKAGKIDAALAAKHMRESLAQDQGITAARNSMENARQVGNTSPALRLRRYGDNLEVLVFYDRSGKISMDSPVRNVREETGERKELGDTKAKVLGEFVGAKGYEVDSYTALIQRYDGDHAGSLTLSNIESKFRQKEEDQMGIRLSLSPQASNPHGSFGAVLPPNGAKGAYRITTRYFIPKDNRVISGFYLIHGVGRPIGEKILDDKGNWISEKMNGESSNDTGNLLLYLAITPEKKPADAKDESVVLGEIKVEYTRFSAYLHAKSGPDGRLTESIKDPLKQPLFISCGEFVPTN